MSRMLVCLVLNLTLFSLINVSVNFFLSLNKTRIAPLVVTAALAQILLIYIFHSNFYQVIIVTMLVLLALLISLLSYYAIVFIHQKDLKNPVSLISTPNI